MNPNTSTQVNQTFNPSTLAPNQVNIGTLEKPNVVQAVTPSTPKIQTTPINAGIIGNTQPLNIPQVNTTQAQDAHGAIVATVTQPENTQIVEPTQPTTTPNTQTSQGAGLRDQIAKLIGLQSGEAAATTAAQEQVGLSDKQLALNDINKKITTTSRAYDEQIKNLSKNGTGYNGGNQVAISDLNRQKNEDLANLAIIQSGANGDLQTANDIIKSKMDAQFEPIKNQIASLTQLYNLTQNDLSESEKLQVQTQIDQQKQSAQNLYSSKQNAYQTALQNGAPASVLKAIGEAATPEQAQQAVGSYGQNQLDQQYKRAQIASIYSTIAEKNAKSNPKNFITPPIINPETGKADPSSQLASVIDGANAKDNVALQAINGVVAATQQLAENNADGKFPAISFGSLGGAIPLFTNQKGQDNLTAIEAINLKVQQWASGAALTKQQTDQVERITPKNGDTNTQIRNKTNALTNFMLNQAKGALTSQGIKYDPMKIDFFSSGSQLTSSDVSNMDNILNK